MKRSFIGSTTIPRHRPSESDSRPGKPSDGLTLVLRSSEVSPWVGSRDSGGSPSVQDIDGFIDYVTTTQTRSTEPSCGTLRHLDRAGCQPVRPAAGRPATVERSGTVIETDDDIRQALLSGHKGRQPGPPVAVDPPAPIPAPPPPAAARPQSRSARRCGRRSLC